MSNYQHYCHAETAKKTPTTEGISNKWFYVISTFFGLAILGLFIDDNDNWSLTYFQNNMDMDTIIGFSFILIVWIYFLLNSHFMIQSRKDKR